MVRELTEKGYQALECCNCLHVAYEPLNLHGKAE
jgi:hypothetical protein